MSPEDSVACRGIAIGAVVHHGRGGLDFVSAAVDERHRRSDGSSLQRLDARGDGECDTARAAPDSPSTDAAAAPPAWCCRSRSHDSAS